MENEIDNDHGINQRWACTNIGMRINVPAYWWEGCRGNCCYPGSIVDYNAGNGRWLFELDNDAYPDQWAINWTSVRNYADKQAPNYNNYNLRPYLPVTRAVTPDFDNTSDDIKDITVDMITKLKVNKDKLPTNSYRQSGWQAFLLEFSHMLKRTKTLKQIILHILTKRTIVMMFMV